MLLLGADFFCFEYYSLFGCSGLHTMFNCTPFTHRNVVDSDRSTALPKLQVACERDRVERAMRGRIVGPLSLQTGDCEKDGSWRKALALQSTEYGKMPKTVSSRKRSALTDLALSQVGTDDHSDTTFVDRILSRSSRRTTRMKSHTGSCPLLQKRT